MADRGEISNFPGVTANYDEPEEPDLRLSVDQMDVDQCVDAIVELLKKRGIFA